MPTSKLVDQYGRPIELDELEEEIATVALAGVRNPWYESVANRITPERLGEILRRVDEGDSIDYLTLAEEMEERDLHYQAELGKRKLAISGLDLVIESATDDAQDVKISDFVEEALLGEEVDSLVTALTDALGKSYSVCEIIWDHSGKEWFPQCYKWRDPRFFRYDYETGAELRLLDLKDPSFGIPLTPYKFICHEPKLKMGLQIRCGLARLASVAFMCKGYTWKDWMAFAEVFGMPLRLGKYGPQATREEQLRLLRAVSRLGTDAAAIIPKTMEIEFVKGESTSGSDKLFQGLSEYLDEQITIGILGQTATTKGTPGKLGNEKERSDVRKDINKSDAKQMATTLRRLLVKPLVDLNFGPQPRNRYPKVRLQTEEQKDLVQMSQWLPPMVKLGMPVGKSWARDQFGVPEPADDEELLSQPEPPPAFGAPGAPGEDPKDAKKPGSKEPPEPDRREKKRDSEKDKEAVARELVRRMPPDMLVALAAQASASRSDEIDDLADAAMDGWRKVMDPILDPILQLAQTAQNTREFVTGLKKLKVGKDHFARELAVATFKARGLGNTQRGST